MKFDPTKKHGLISGQSTLFPNAKFEQNGYVYDASHKCLNPDEGESVKQSDAPMLTDVPPPPTQRINEEQAEQIKKLQKDLTESAEKLQKAKLAVDISNTASKKSQLTKATKAYSRAFDALEKFKLDNGID